MFAIYAMLDIIMSALFLTWHRASAKWNDNIKTNGLYRLPRLVFAINHTAPRLAGGAEFPPRISVAIRQKTRQRQ